MGLLRRLLGSFELTPSFAELEQANHDVSARYPRERVLAELLARRTADLEDRAELHRLLATRPFDAAAHARSRAILGRVYAGFVRPGTVEDLWYIDGLLDRLRALDE